MAGVSHRKAQIADHNNKITGVCLVAVIQMYTLGVFLTVK
jgi:hypothetical protein